MSLATVLRGCLGAGVVFVAPSSRFITLTPEAAELLGLPQQGNGNPAWDSLPAPLQERAAEALRAERPMLHQPVKIPSTSGQSLTLDVCAFPAGDGTGAGVVLLLANQNQLQQCEERLQRLDRLANLGTLAAGMAHEIKNALVAGRTFVELLLEKNPEAELTDVVRRELARIDAIVGRLLKFARPAQASFRNLRVHEILEHALRLLQPQLENRELKLDRQFGAAPDQVCGDEGELLQAFMNLLLNALEAMTPEGKLTVTTENTNAASIAQVRITVSDTGMGIPPENLPHLFDPFFTTKPTGTGLGLAVTKRIIEEHHGSLGVLSQPGQGTSFAVTLPVVT